MDKKKSKLTLSGIAKKSIENIELAKTQSKNSVVIEKKPTRFANRGSFNRSSVSRPITKGAGFKNTTNPISTPKSSAPITNDYEKRKLAEQRATKRLKGDPSSKDSKGNIKSYRLIIECNYKIFEKDKNTKSKKIIESFNFNNSDNKFELRKYEVSIQKDLMTKIIENIVLDLYSL